MKRFFAFSLIILALFSTRASAQDWQIGSGADYKKEVHPKGGNRTLSYPELASGHTIWNGGHNDAFWGIQLGYINKQWVTETDEGTIKENLFGEPNKRLHGLQIGVNVQPCFNFGLGVHSGLYYEGCFSQSDFVRNEMGWDKFSEHSIYLPLHALWRIPFSRNYSMSVYGGLGFNWALYGTYNDTYRYYDYDGWHTTDSWEHETQVYGYNGWPKRTNVQFELGAEIRLNVVRLGFTYSRGMTHHNCIQIPNSDGYFKTRQDKLAITFSLAIGKDDL